MTTKINRFDENKPELVSELTKNYKECVTTLARERKPEACILNKTTGLFTAPIGITQTEVKLISVHSVFRVAHLADSNPFFGARCVEYYEFTKQPISIFIVLPDFIVLPLHEITIDMLQKNIKDTRDRFVRKRFKVKIPTAIFKELENAKVSCEDISERPASRTPVPVGDEFFCHGPFIVVLYEREIERVLGVSRVYKPDSGLGSLTSLISKLKKRDMELLKGQQNSHHERFSRIPSNQSLNSGAAALSVEPDQPQDAISKPRKKEATCQSKLEVYEEVNPGSQGTDDCVEQFDSKPKCITFAQRKPGCSSDDDDDDCNDDD